jgi:hypothetical protein
VVGRLSTALGEHTGIGLVCIGAPALVIAAVVAWRARGVYEADIARCKATDDDGAPVSGHE